MLGPDADKHWRHFATWLRQEEEPGSVSVPVRAVAAGLGAAAARQEQAAKLEVSFFGQNLVEGGPG